MPICGQILLGPMEVKKDGSCETSLRKRMTPAQITEAQRLARECVRKKYKGCSVELPHFNFNAFAVAYDNADDAEIRYSLFVPCQRL